MLETTGRKEGRRQHIMTDVKVIKREAMFIPIKDISNKVVTRVKEKLSFRFYEEKACAKCDNRSERHNDICDSCAAFNGGYDLGSVVKIKDNKYLKFPIGSSRRILKYMSGQGVNARIVDKSPEAPIKKIKFTGTLKPEQVPALKAIIKRKRGVLRAPPRSGKTVIGTAMVCKLRMKTLIIASQRDWLMGFHETFVGSKTQKPLTDLNPKRIKLCKTLKDFEDHDVCLVTIQTFYSEGGQSILRKIRDMFQLVICDEVHTAAADKYIKVLANLNFEYGLGLSGTPSRKDRKYILVDNVLGGIMHDLIVKGERPVIKLTRTKYKKTQKGNARWDQMVSSLENDKGRIKLMAKIALQDVEAKHMILIPMGSLKGIKKLVAEINKQAGKRLAYEFTGGTKKKDRDEYIQKARTYKIKILVGTMKILSTGINIPRASMLYEQALSSNMENAEQRMRRVLTPMEGKPQPCIRYFLDNFNVRRNCLRNEYFKVMLPKMKPKLTDTVRDQLKNYFSERDNSLHGVMEF